MKPKVKGEIDLTDQPGQQHIFDRPGKTEGGTTADDLNKEHTEAWPNGLPRKEFTDMQRKVIRGLILSPDASHTTIADSIGCTSETVRQVRHKISAMDKGDAVPFDVPDEPNPNIKIVKPYLKNNGDGFEKEPETDLDKEQLKKRIYELADGGLDASQIGERLGLTVYEAAGYLGNRPEEAEEEPEPKPEPEPEPEPMQMQKEHEVNLGIAGGEDMIAVQLHPGELLDILQSDGLDRSVKETLLQRVS